MTKRPELGGSFKLPGASLTVKPHGLRRDAACGPAGVGPPRDVDAAIAVCEKRSRPA